MRSSLPGHDPDIRYSVLKVDQAELLVRLFGRVLIPQAVWGELTRHHATLPPLLEVRQVNDTARVERLLGQADAGEAEAVSLALETQADVLLIDDKKGPKLAEAEGVPCLGLPALVLAAKQRALIGSVRELLDMLERRGHPLDSP